MQMRKVNREKGYSHTKLKFSFHSLTTEIYSNRNCMHLPVLIVTKDYSGGLAKEIYHKTETTNTCRTTSLQTA